MRYAICMWKWKMVWKWALSCMCCLHFCIVMLDLFCSGCAALSFPWSYQIIWRKRRHFNTFNATYCSIVTANHIKQLLYLYINSHSRLPAMEEKWSSLIVYTTECYVSLISFFLSFIFITAGLFLPLVLCGFSSFVHHQLWYKRNKGRTVKIPSHAVHDGNTYAHYLTWLFRAFNWFHFQERCVCVCVCRAHFDISIARSRLHFELASRVNTCYDLSTVHRMYQMLSSDFLWLHIHDYTVLNWHTE